MEIIGKISKGSKMDQVYISKNRTGFNIGNYVIIRLIEEKEEVKPSEKLYFYGIKNLEPIKLEMINKILRIINQSYNSCENIFITGSFLDKGFQFNDIDIIIIGGNKINGELIKENVEKKTGIKVHILALNNKELTASLKVDPTWKLMLNKCISKKRFLVSPEKKVDYKYLDAQMIKSKILIENFDFLNGNEKYKLIRNVVSIYLFIKDKKISESNIDKEIKEKLETEPEELKNNFLDKKILTKYKNFYSKLEEEIIKNAAKQEKTD